mmetsp:Transcript_10375/g.25737  ORF Transcript_10375/g.25737 Transcript_10375/m.25737 type:complete len:248 (-) Transcript_10375:1419-2162(-)
MPTSHMRARVTLHAHGGRAELAAPRPRGRRGAHRPGDGHCPFGLPKHQYQPSATHVATTSKPTTRVPHLDLPTPARDALCFPPTRFPARSNCTHVGTEHAPHMRTQIPIATVHSMHAAAARRRYTRQHRVWNAIGGTLHTLKTRLSHVRRAAPSYRRGGDNKKIAGSHAAMTKRLQAELQNKEDAAKLREKEEEEKRPQRRDVVAKIRISRKSEEKRGRARHAAAAAAVTAAGRVPLICRSARWTFA